VPNTSVDFEWLKEEAAAFGFYESLGTTMFPKLQILTIKGLLDVGP
jgi:hypothetical protein